ncbi:MAG: hypothetical protein H6671_10510 [Anaerolineaceae bacterium]|nr:hypothetical protein [Anaerolineaceae bacterium]
MAQLMVHGRQVTYDYDTAQNMLYILFEANPSATFYADVPDMPGVMLRYRISDESLVGITVHDGSNWLAADVPQDAALRQLVHTFVRQLDPQSVDRAS